MTILNQPAAPGQGPNELPTPSLPDFNQPVTPGEGPEGFPTPSVPDINQPVTPGEGPEGFPTPSLPSQPIVRVCPTGYRAAIVRGNQRFTDLLIENDVSYQAMRNANPALPTNRIASGTFYCAPPPGSRGLCSNGSFTHILDLNENLYTLALTVGVTPGALLVANPNLAPNDFVPGRVVCVP